MAQLPTAEQQPTMTIWPETGKALGLSRSATYDAANRGEIPSIRIGRRLLVPTAQLRSMLGLDPTNSDASAIRLDPQTHGASSAPA